MAHIYTILCVLMLVLARVSEVESKITYSSSGEVGYLYCSAFDICCEALHSIRPSIQCSELVEIPETRGYSLLLSKNGETLSEWTHSVFNETAKEWDDLHPLEDSIVSTFVDEAGGMHRRVSIRVGLPQTASHFSGRFLVHLAGTFVNTDDDIGDMKWIQTKVIDQEAPDFMTSQDALILVVDRQPIVDGVWEGSFELHLRYAMPSKTSRDGGYTKLAIVPLVLLEGGYLEDGGSTEIPLATPSSVSLPSPPIVLSVATGYADDMWPVTAITLSAAILGAIYLIYSISRIV